LCFRYWSELEDKDAPNASALADAYLASHPKAREELKEEDQKYQVEKYVDFLFFP